MLIFLGHRDDEPDNEPIASFDAASGTWWAGRYVGEVHYEGRTLRVEPRFGMPALMRWLTAIWGVRLVDSKGRYEQQRIWLWLVIAHLWAARLISAAKHGLPFRRVERTYNGRALRGRLMVGETAIFRANGDDRLVSTTRTREVDSAIGSILLAAFDRLHGALGSSGERNYWLPDRGKTLIDDLQSALGGRASKNDTGKRAAIRYSPITENYRSVVDLSLSILAHRPRIATSGGDGKTLGVLLDMAEIWELYVAKLLQIGLPGWHVSHTGRSTEHFRWLLRSVAGNDKFGSLRPDIIVTDQLAQCVAVVDAKYKTNRINASNRTGILRDDLYQLTAYLSGFGDPDARLDGFLIYPADDEGQVTGRLAPKSPWRVSSAPEKYLWFISTSSEHAGEVQGLSPAERAMTNLIQMAITSPAKHMVAQADR